MRDRKKHWREQQTQDYYYQQAKVQGYRSRAAFKLLEINKKYQLIKPKYKVLDLGAAPGGWSQVVRDIVGKQGRVVAVDCLEMKPIDGVEFIHDDLTNVHNKSTIHSLLGNKIYFDLVISDMAPNLSGVKVVDQHQSMRLAELSLEIAQEWLKPGGAIIIKLFQGIGFDEFLVLVRKLFKKVIIFKPKSSSGLSREVYCLGTSYTI